jgi:glyoxylate reductase
VVKPKVFVSGPVPQLVLERLARECSVRVRNEDAPVPAEELIEGCRDAEGLLVVGGRVTEDLLRHSPRLKVVSTPSVGYDHIDVAACTRRRIVVANAAGTLEDTTADAAFALLLAVARRVIEADAFVRSGRWKHWQWGLLHGSDVHHKTLGIIGFGKIGQAMARRGLGFAMRIIYYSRHRVAEEIERELHAEYVDREALLRESDFISLHVPLTPETRHLIQARDFKLMKPAAFLINTARGPVVDEAALVEGLKNKTIAGAGLDVFEQEPAVHPALLAMHNVVLMPHVGSATGETRLRMAMLAAENLLDVLHGRRPTNTINPEVFG